MEKTHVSKADSDEKSPGFSEKSRETFWWFPYGTSYEKVSHNFPENFPRNFPDRTFSEISGNFRKVAGRIFLKKKFSSIFFLKKSVGDFSVETALMFLKL